MQKKTTISLKIILCQQIKYIIQLYSLQSQVTLTQSKIILTSRYFTMTHFRISIDAEVKGRSTEQLPGQ